MSKLSTGIARELVRVRAKSPPPEVVSEEHDKAHRRYVTAVINGDGSKSSGETIMTYYVEREAWRRYAKEMNYHII